MTGAPDVVQRLVTSVARVFPLGRTRRIPSPELEPRLPIMAKWPQTPMAKRTQLGTPFTTSIAVPNKLRRLRMPPRWAQEHATRRAAQYQRRSAVPGPVPRPKGSCLLSGSQTAVVVTLAAKRVAIP